MRTMSKSALRVAREALAVGRAALPPYGSRFSRRDYTQPQLFALLVLKQFLRTDYRGLVAMAGLFNAVRWQWVSLWRHRSGQNGAGGLMAGFPDRQTSDS
jgi:hypothetical protein